jgi:hypothetical protein
MIGQTGAPRPERDFTILGRLDRSWHVWVTAASSPLRTLEDAVRQAARRPLLFSLNEVGSATFVSMSVAADILGIPIELVAGFAGTRAEVLAALRGDVDVVCLNYDTSADLIASGELRPILQISDVASAPALAGVAMLGGEHGVVRARANALGRDASHAVRITRALVSLIGAGRLIVAPPALDSRAFECLARTVHETLTDDEVMRVWAHPVDVADAEGARTSVAQAAKQAPEIVPIVEKAMRRLRG